MAGWFLISDYGVAGADDMHSPVKTLSDFFTGNAEEFPDFFQAVKNYRFAAWVVCFVD